MVARTLPLKSRDKPKPREPLPSVPPDKVEVRQSVADELRHAQEQIALTRTYSGRRGDTRSTELLSTLHSSLTCACAPKAT
jgi:hypothetical protein